MSMINKDDWRRQHANAVRYIEVALETLKRLDTPYQPVSRPNINQVLDDMATAREFILMLEGATTFTYLGKIPNER